MELDILDRKSLLIMGLNASLMKSVLDMENALDKDKTHQDVTVTLVMLGFYAR
jgi:hypothetical protein